MEPRGEEEVTLEERARSAEDVEAVGAHVRRRVARGAAILVPSMPPISAVVITLNEEQRLAAALESVHFCDEIVVLDAGSTDRTRAIAAAAGARVEVSAPWPGFVEQRSRAVAAARHDWVLAVDADERVTPALREEIQAAA